MRSISQAQGALQELAKLLPNTALRVQGSEIEEVPLDALRPDDLILARPGGSIAADGIVAEGTSEVNESMITGESRPVTKRSGDKVIAGTVNGSGSLRIRVTGIGEKTALAGIMRLVAQAQSSRSRAQALADRAAFWLTLAAIVAGAVTFVAWLSIRGDAAFAVEPTVTVLVVSCPHALGLAVPWSSRFPPRWERGVRSATERGIVPGKAEYFKAIPGVGVSARVEGRTLLMGGPALVKARAVEISRILQTAIDQAAARSGPHSSASSANGRASGRRTCSRHQSIRRARSTMGSPRSGCFGPSGLPVSPS